MKKAFEFMKLHRDWFVLGAMFIAGVVVAKLWL